MTKARSLSDFIESDGSVTLVDNQKIKVGTGNDLEIYHDGSNSYVKDAGTGNLNLQGENLALENTSGDNYLVGVNGSFVKLYYSGSEKLATTSTGVSVTGTITASGLVYPSSDGTNGQVLTTDGSGNLSFSTISGYTDSDVETYLDGGTSTPVFSNTEISGTIKLDGNYPTGSNNVALGNAALGSLTSGSGNTAVGSLALDANTTGIQNTVVGYLAGTSITTGNYNTAVGVVALQNYDVTDCVAIGTEALRDCQGNRNIGIGNEAGRFATGADNVIIGDLAGDASSFSGNNNIGIGSGALGGISSGSNNTAVGRSALAVNTTGGDNTAMGRNALDANTTGLNNTALGEGSLTANTTASHQTVIGKGAGETITTGAENVLVGHEAGRDGNFSASTMIGRRAGAITTGINNTFVGHECGTLVTSGTKNTIIGRFTGSSGGLDIRTLSNNIVLSDGDGNPRAFFDSSGNMGLGLTNGDAGNAKLVIKGTGVSAGSDAPCIDFDNYGNYGSGASQSINFRMGRTGQATDQPASIKGYFQGGGATAGQTSIGFLFTTIDGNIQNEQFFIDAANRNFKFNSAEIPKSNNPNTQTCLILGPSTSTPVSSGLTSSCVLINRGGELYAVDSSHNNTQLTPHNWTLIPEGPSEELAWTYWSQRPNPDNPDQLQGINVDMAKVARKVEDLIGEKLVYTENSNMDDHTHQSIIADIQSTLADLTTRIEALEG